MTSQQGHPRHQLRQFTVTARRGNNPRQQIRVTAQTKHDAVFRAGIALARRHPDTDLTQWIVTGVLDPAPFTWTPGEENTT